jgi:hypothetical protein
LEAEPGSPIRIALLLFLGSYTMDEPLRPTADAIEAALSAYDTRHDDGSPNEDCLEFIKLMCSNERLKHEIHAAAAFVGELDLPAELHGEFDPEVVRLYKVNMLCDMFFWVGWYARGAMEQAEELKRMTE